MLAITDRIPVIVSSSGSENEQQRTFYRGETEDHALEVEIIDEPCTDSINDLDTRLPFLLQ